MSDTSVSFSQVIRLPFFKPASLEWFTVEILPSISYVPNYITPEEEDRLLGEICCSKTPWTLVSGRRLRNYGGIIQEKSGVLLPSPMPRWLQALLERLALDTGAFGFSQQPNHGLLNAYQPGQGIMPHEDGPLYHPGVCILSLGAPAVMGFREKRSEEGCHKRPAASVLLMPQSLLVFSGRAYSDCLHGIEAVTDEVLDETVANLAAHPELALGPGGTLPRGGERFSLTVRRVLRTRKNLLRL